MRLRGEGRNRDFQPRRVEAQDALANQPRQDRAVRLPLVVDHRRFAGIDDQVMVHAGEAEIALQFRRAVNAAGGWR